MADRTLEIKITGNTAGLEKAVQSAGGKVDKLGHSAKIAGAAFVALSAGKAVVDFLGEATKEAIANESALRRDGLAVKNAGENWKNLQKPIDDALTKMSTTSGFIKTDLQESFAKFEQITHNHTAALRLENDAMNVSAQRGISLAAATKSLQMVYLGSATAGRKLGIVVAKLTTEHDAVKKKFSELAATTKGHLTPAQKELEKAQLHAADAADKQATSTKALDKIHTTFAGGVAARTNTMAGKLAIFQAKWADIKVKIGDAIIPYLLVALDKLMSAFDSLSTFVEKNKTLVEALGVVIGVVAGGVIAYEVAITAAEVAHKLWAVATGIQTAAQWLLNAALNANPIGLVILAVAGLTAGIVLLYTHSKTARDIINTAFGDIKTAAKDALGFITDTVIPAFTGAWDTIQPAIGPVLDYFIGPLKVAFDTVKGVINVVKDLLNGDFSKAWTDIKTMMGNVFGDINTALSGLPGKLLGLAKQLPGAAAQVGQAIVSGILNGLGGLLDALVNAVQDAVTGALGSVTGFLSSGGAHPAVAGGHPVVHKKLATGGIVTRPTFALIGEAGPEAVIPLSRGGGGGMGNTFIVNNTTQMDPRAVARAWAWQSKHVVA